MAAKPYGGLRRIKPTRYFGGSPTCVVYEATGHLLQFAGYYPRIYRGDVQRLEVFLHLFVGFTVV